MSLPSGDACPTGCGRKRRQAQLACGPCWGGIPRHLQREVHRTWRAYRAAVGKFPPPSDTRDRRLEYEAAAENALAAVP